MDLHIHKDSSFLPILRTLLSGSHHHPLRANTISACQPDLGLLGTRIRLFPPSTLFQPFTAHLFSSCVHIIATLPDLHFLPALSPFQLLSLFIHVTPIKLLKHIISITFTFLVSAPFVHEVSAPTLLSDIDQILCYFAHTS